MQHTFWPRAAIGKASVTASTVDLGRVLVAQSVQERVLSPQNVGCSSVGLVLVLTRSVACEHCFYCYCTCAARPDCHILGRARSGADSGTAFSSRKRGAILELSFCLPIPIPVWPACIDGDPAPRGLRRAAVPLFVMLLRGPVLRPRHKAAPLIDTGPWTAVTDARRDERTTPADGRSNSLAHASSVPRQPIEISVVCTAPFAVGS